MRHSSPKAIDSSNTLPEKYNKENLSITSKKDENIEIRTSADAVDNTAGNVKKGSKRETVPQNSPVRVYTYKVTSSLLKKLKLLTNANIFLHLLCSFAS